MLHFSQTEIISLRARVDDFESRYRRDNILFYGIKDSVGDTWPQTENTMIDVLPRSLYTRFMASFVERARSLGSFTTRECRPVIVKFTSFNTKDSVFMAHYTFKSLGVSVNSDYPMAIRQSRK